jgi:hypothetical protein
METQAATNNRNCSRAPLELGVEVLHGEHERLAGRLVDISFGGAYLEADTHTFRPRDVVTVCFELARHDGIQAYALSATVARTGEDGVGLEFDEYDHETIVALREVYHQLLR